MHLRPSISAACAALFTCAALAAGTHDMPTAKPESVGMSTERLARLNNGMKELIDSGRLAGTVTMVARHGKVVEFESAGKRDLASNSPNFTRDILEERRKTHRAKFEEIIEQEFTAHRSHRRQT